MKLSQIVCGFVYEALKPLLHATGNELVPLRRHEKRGFTLAALERMRARGCEPSTFLDVGASDGRWSLAAEKVFPQAHFHLVEPLLEHHAQLQKLILQKNRFSFVGAAASDRCGAGSMTVSEDLHGSALSEGEEGARTVSLTTLDNECESRRLKPPFAIKMDTHGVELDILSGASNMLGSTELVIIEAYNFCLSERSVRFHELCACMERMGFRVADLVDLVWRPTDQVLWQMDLFFRPHASIDFKSDSYGS